MNPVAHPQEAPPSLAQAFAAMAGEMRAQADRRAQDWGPVAALHALLLATLARLVGRLETIFLAWQQGQLPPPARARTPANAAQPRPHAPHASARRRSQMPGRARTPPAMIPTCRAARATCPRLLPASDHPRPVAHTALSGPIFSNPDQAPRPCHAIFVTISY